MSKKKRKPQNGLGVTFGAQNSRRSNVQVKQTPPVAAAEDDIDEPTIAPRPPSSEQLTSTTMTSPDEASAPADLSSIGITTVMPVPYQEPDVRISQLEHERDQALAEQAVLSVQLAVSDAKDVELLRLRTENVEFRARLQELEAAQSEILGLQAEKLALTTQLAQERARRDELRKHDDLLSRREQELAYLQEQVDEMSEKWDAGKVAALELERGALSKEIEILKEYVSQRDERIASLERQLEEASPATVEMLRQRAATLAEQNSALSENIKRYEQHAADLAYNAERFRRAPEVEKQNYQLSAENASLKLDLAKFKVQQSQYEALNALVTRVQLDNQELKQAIDVANESEQRRQKQGERVFDALRTVAENPKFNQPLGNKIRPWLNDDQVVERAYQLAEQRGFIYTYDQIRWFLASIRSSRFVILKGFSGLGKTSLPIIFARAVGAACEVVPVQPSWKSKVDLLGFFNHFDQRFLPTLFTKALLKAQLPAFQDRHFFIVLDEMNLSRVEYYFSDFNVKLEDPNDPTIELFDNASLGVKLPASGIGQFVRDGNRMLIPRNVTFVGTVNDDETTFSISDKIYDRAQVMDFQESARSGRGRLPKEDESLEPLSFTGYLDAQPHEPNDADVDQFLDDLNKELRARFYANLSYRPRGQIQSFMQAFFMAGGHMSDALDLQMVSKVLPKIRYSHRSGFETDLQEFAKFLQQHWPYPRQSPVKTKLALDLLKAQA